MKGGTLHRHRIGVMGQEKIMPITDSVDDISSQKVRALDAYWRARLDSGVAPLRGTFEPYDLRRLLPNILIVDITAAPFSVRYRLIGTKVVDVSRVDFTGKRLDECDFQAEDSLIWHQSYQRVLESGAPVFGHVRIPMNEDSNRGLIDEFGIFPLSHDGKNIHQCIAIEDFRPIDRFVPAEKIRPMRVR